jgi:hypothetical protein
MQTRRPWTALEVLRCILFVGIGLLAEAGAACVLPEVELPPAERHASAATPDTTPENTAAQQAPAPSRDAERGASSIVDAGSQVGERLPSDESQSGSGGGKASDGSGGLSGSYAGTESEAATAGADASSVETQPKLQLGASCRAAMECASGSCADGFCCENDCGSTCSRCSTGGKCLLLDGERDTDTCLEICTRGTCLLPSGRSCASDQQCASGICDPVARTDPSDPNWTLTGRCCDVPCHAQCTACTADGRACRTLSSGEDDVCKDDYACADGQCLRR